MRLTEEERRIIRETVSEVYGPTAVVRLFGSRVHDYLRGGDIDLHIEAEDLGPEVFPSRRSRLWASLQERLGEQKIDIVITRRGRSLKAIEQAAYEEGLTL